MPKIEQNEHIFSKVENENFIEYKGQEYRIKSMQETLIRNTPVKVVSNARHRFYDLVDIRRSTTLTTGAKSINVLLSFIFTGTRYSFAVIDSFSTKEFENFGNDNCLALFNKVIESFEAEFEVIGTQVRVRKQIGSYIDMQFRHNHNITTFRKNIDTSNLSTFIRGTGKLNEDGTPVVSAEYTSPNAHLYTDDEGNIELKEAPEYSNETITKESTLLEHLARSIQDEPDVSMELEFTVIKDAGYTKPVPERGDVVPTILEELGVNVDLRIMEIETHPDTSKSPRVVLANYKKTFANQLVDYQKSLLDQIWDKNSKKLRYNVHDEAVKRATEMLNNSLTELEYPPGMGIIARDPKDPNKFVAYRSSGLGITSNGGLTFDEAITHLGINTSLLTAGQIFTNNIQIIGDSDLFYWDGNHLIAIDANDPNKFVRINSSGLYIAKGAMTIERPDGFKLINNGEANWDYSVTTPVPPAIEDDGSVVLDGSFYRTIRVDYKAFTYVKLRHTSRYLFLDFYGKSYQGNSTIFVAVFDQSDNQVAWTKTSSGLSENIPITIDMGTPTGKTKFYYIRFRSNHDNTQAYLQMAPSHMYG